MSTGQDPRRSARGHALFWLIIAIAIFALIMVPVVQAGTFSRQSMYARQLALERTLEAHRLARWATSRPEARLLKLPGELTGALPAEWESRVDLHLAAAEGASESDALVGAKVRIAITKDVEGRRRLHRVAVQLTTPDRTSIVVERMVSLR